MERIFSLYHRRWGMLLVLLVGIILSLSILLSHVPAVKAECRSDQPPVKLHIELYTSDPQCNGGSSSARQPIPLNCPFSLNITAKAADGCLNDGSGNVQLSYSPDGLLEKLPRGGNAFVPWHKGLGGGTVVVTARLDGLAADITLALGTASPVPSGSGSPGGGDPAETTELCAYKDSNGKYICINGTQDDKDCNSPPRCRKDGKIICERKLPTDCKGGPAITNPTLNLMATPTDLGGLIGQVFNWSLSVVGLVVFVMILFSGFQWLTAAGDPGQISQARNRMTNALLGAALLLSAYLILNVINPNLVRQTTTLPALPGGELK